MIAFIVEYAQVAGFVLGLLYLWYEYHASKWVWLYSLLMPMVSMVVYYSKGLYADFGINIYYVLASIYGLLQWHGTSKQKPRHVTHAGVWMLVRCAACTCIIWLCIWVLLTNFTDSTVPVADAFTTSMSIVATWMLARKYIEQWVAWIVVDVVCVGLYVYKGIPFYAVLYAVYIAVGVAGYRKWAKMLR